MDSYKYWLMLLNTSSPTKCDQKEISQGKTFLIIACSDSNSLQQSNKHDYVNPLDPELSRIYPETSTSMSTLPYNHLI